MGRSLKEALLDQFALLQERGLAPSEMPQEDEAPLVVVESAPRGRAARGRRDVLDRIGEDDLGLDGFDKDRRRAPRRDHRGLEEGRERRRGAAPARGRGRGRPGEGEADLGLPVLAPLSPAGGGRPFGGPPRGPMGGPGGPRPPQRPGMGAPRPGMAPGTGRPPAGRTEMLQQRAEQRRRDEEDIAEMRRLLTDLRGEPADDTFMESFGRALAEETGALPPPRIVVEAIRQSQTADPRTIGDAVRAYYRRSRSARPQAPGGERQRPPADARAAARLAAPPPPLEPVATEADGAGGAPSPEVPPAPDPTSEAAPDVSVEPTPQPEIADEQPSEPKPPVPVGV